ncbi:MFS transporter [Streptomyces javensis]|uniref:MFS transporter n=1 Tax=Streptomyces javensis TaxID=114698 RepID=A0ABN1XEF9_9ACTN
MAAQHDVPEGNGDAPATRPMKIVGAACFGHMIEWYEFGVYGYLATVIAKVFFPAASDSAGLLATLAIFGVAFFARPVGAVLFGNLGDKFGRRTVLASTILLMGGSTVLIGVLPTYGQVGVLAPVLIVICRLMQGLSAGGETSGAATFLAEYAPQRRRALWATSIQAVGVIAFVIAALFVAGLTAVLTEDQLYSWGWRIPFLMAGPLAGVGLYLRFKIAETPAYQKVQEAAPVKQPSPAREALVRHWRPILLLFAIVTVESVASYTAKTYLPTYLIATVGLSKTTALLTTSATLVLSAVLVPCYALLSDRVGRKPLLIGGTVTLFAVSVPSFLMIGSGSVAGAVAGQMLAIIPGTAISVAVVVMQTELFPTSVRYTGAAIGYNTAYAAFGGSAPFAAAALITATGTKLAPGFYFMAIAAVFFVALVKIPETFRRSLSADADSGFGTGADSASSAREQQPA